MCAEILTMLSRAAIPSSVMVSGLIAVLNSLYGGANIVILASGEDTL